MSDRSLKLRVVFAALDKLTAPLKAIRGGARDTAAALKATSDRLSALKRNQVAIGSFRSLEGQLQSTSRELEVAKTNTARLRAEFAAADNPTRALARSLETAEKAEGKLSDRHEEQGRKLQALSGKLSAAGIDVADLARHEERLALDVHDTTRQLDRQKDALDRVARSRERVDRMRDIGGRMQSGGVTAMAAGAAIGAPVVAATVKTASFQTQLTDIAQKAELSRQQAEGMGRAFDRMGPKVAQLPSKMAEGVDTLLGLGASVPDAMRAIDPIGRAATAYDADIQDLAASTFASLSNLKVPAQETARTLDIMAQAGKAGAFEMKDMAQHFPALTGSFNALGQKGVGAVADLSAALQIAIRDTGDAGVAANNIQNLLNKINTKDTIRNFKNFGVDLQAELKAAAKRGESPIEAIAKLTDRALGGDMSKISFLFGDAQVQAAIRPLVRNLDEYRKIRGEALAARGTVEADFAERMNDAAAKFRKLQATAESLSHGIGNALLPHASALMDKLTAVGESISVWIEQNPQLVAWLAKGAAILAILLVVLGGLAVAIGSVLGPFAYLGFMAGRAWPVLKLIGAAAKFAFSPLLQLARVLPLLAGGIARAGAFLLANPIVLAVAAIAFAGFMIWKHWDNIKVAFDIAKGWLAQAWEWIRAKFLSFPALFGPLGMVAGLVISHWEMIKGAFRSGWDRVKAFFSAIPGQMRTIGQNILAGLLQMLKPGALVDRLISIARSGVAAFKNYFGIKSPSRLFAGFGGDITEGLSRGIARGADAPLDRVRRLSRDLAAAWAASAAAPALALASPAAPPIDIGGTSDHAMPAVADNARAHSPVFRPAIEVSPRLAISLAMRPDGAAGLRDAIAALSSRLLGMVDRGARTVGAAGSLRAPAATRPARDPARAPIAIGPVTINLVQQPGQSAQDVAAEIRRELEALERRAAAARRSEYDDEV